MNIKFERSFSRSRLNGIFRQVKFYSKSAITSICIIFLFVELKKQMILKEWKYLIVLLLLLLIYNMCLIFFG